MNAITRTKISRLPMILGLASLMAIPVAASARPHHDSRHSYHHYRPSHHYRSYSHSYYRPPVPFPAPFYRPKTPKYEHESFQIFGTPGGGLGFHYSESKGRGW